MPHRSGPGGAADRHLRQTALAPPLSTAIVVTGLMVVGLLSFGVGLVLDTVVRGRREVRRLAYLALPVGE